jgi:hypothetical protein
MNLFQIVIMYLILYYYTQKASGILKNRKDILMIIRWIFTATITVLLMLTLATIITIGDYVTPDGTGFTDDLPSFLVGFSQVFNWTPLLVVIPFFLILKSIENSLKNRPLVNEVDMRIYSLQMETLKKLKFCLYLTTFNVFLCFFFNIL